MSETAIDASAKRTQRRVAFSRVARLVVGESCSATPMLGGEWWIVLMDSEAIRKQHGHTLLDCRSQNAPAAAMMRAGPGRGGVDSRGGAVE
ncbi:hypothetical protein [Arthrobacter sp. efr-133-TYG-120]|uniref:hypothetical protein n=1 Tax=Arthrobacter sp. efr-133-TYG-120 TaxID=3040280 RepID=UPI00254F2942|nr:hypothetical protein [Arthrobacter sp. efr-133-TYG-120]